MWTSHHSIEIYQFFFISQLGWSAGIDPVISWKTVQSCCTCCTCSVRKDCFCESAVLFVSSPNTCIQLCLERILKIWHEAGRAPELDVCTAETHTQQECENVMGRVRKGKRRQGKVGGASRPGGFQPSQTSTWYKLKRTPLLCPLGCCIWQERRLLVAELLNNH